jgi:uncharacterized protein with HEPN domain
VLAAARAISAHLERGALADGLIYDAVRVRLIEIGEAVKGIDPEILAQEPTIPWSDVAGMRDYLTHRYFDTDHAIVSATVERDLPPLHQGRTTAAAIDGLHKLRVASRSRTQCRVARFGEVATSRTACSSRAASAGPASQS